MINFAKTNTGVWRIHVRDTDTRICSILLDPDPDQTVILGTGPYWVTKH